MSKWFLAAGLCAGLLAVAVVGCGPQLTVAKDNMVEWVNRQLGELDVKRVEIEQRIASANTGLKSLRTSRVTADVKIKQIEDDIAPIDAQLTKIKTAMENVRTDLKQVQSTSTAIEKNGEKFTQEKLTGIANDLVAKYKKEMKAKERKETQRTQLKKIQSALAAKEADFSKKLDQMKEEQENIKDMVAEVKSFRSAAASLGDADVSIDENFTKLRDDMTDFKGKLEVVLRTEAGEFDDAAKSMEKVDAAEKYIEATENSKVDAVSTLDDILGK